MTTPSYTPKADRILIERLAPEEKTAGGLVIPETAKEKPNLGRVVAVGPGKLGQDGQRLPLDVVEGEVVMFGKHAGTEIQVDGRDYLLMKDYDVLMGKKNG